MIDIKSLVAEIRKKKAKRVLLQLPEGLKTDALGIVKKLEKSGVVILLSVDTCYGACDMRADEAKRLDCDLIIHVGHSDFGVKSDVPVIYEEYRKDVDPTSLLKKNLSKLKEYEKISLLSTVQYISTLPKAQLFLMQQGKHVYMTKPLRAKYPGQILGCDYSAAIPIDNVTDCFLFIGTGKFHPLGLADRVKKPVLFLDLESGKLESMEEEKRKRLLIRGANVEKAKGCKTFGIVVSTKPGQMHIKAAQDAKEKLGKAGKDAYILVSDELSPSKLLGLKIDCLVDCMCPRMADDSALFKRPIILPEEIGRVIEK